jgi:hypothetical protein
MELTANTVKVFWRDITNICDHAYSTITSDPSHQQLFEMPVSIASGFKSDGKIIERLLGFLELLMRDVTSEPIVGSSSSEFVVVFNDSGVMPKIESNYVLTSRSDEIIMEHLTAVWLALYFCGVPFSHPWERVRRISDEQGGLPTGVCISKAIGDVYRAARQLSFRSPVESENVSKSQVLVLTHFPSVLLKESLSRKERKCTPLAAHQLGRCYALLQLRLYINEGLPIRYLVPLSSFHASLSIINENVTVSPSNAASEIMQWLNQIYSRRLSGQTVELLMDQTISLGIPTCVLGPRTGVYTLDATLDSMLPLTEN